MSNHKKGDVHYPHGMYLSPAEMEVIARAITHKQLQAVDLLVYNRVRRLAEARGLGCWATNVALAEDVGVEPRSVTKIIGRLKRVGLIAEIGIVIGKTHQFRLLFHTEGHLSRIAEMDRETWQTWAADDILEHESRHFTFQINDYHWKRMRTRAINGVRYMDLRQNEGDQTPPDVDPPTPTTVRPPLHSSVDHNSKKYKKRTRSADRVTAPLSKPKQTHTNTPPGDTGHVAADTEHHKSRPQAATSRPNDRSHGTTDHNNHNGRHGGPQDRNGRHRGPDDILITIESSNTTTTPPPKPRKQRQIDLYIPHAKTLREALRRQKPMPFISNAVPETWANELRILGNQLGMDRVVGVLDWFCEHVDKDLSSIKDRLPVLTSARQFRDRFDWIERVKAKQHKVLYGTINDSKPDYSEILFPLEEDNMSLEERIEEEWEVINEDLNPNYGCLYEVVLELIQEAVDGGEITTKRAKRVRREFKARLRQAEVEYPTVENYRSPLFPGYTNPKVPEKAKPLFTYTRSGS